MSDVPEDDGPKTQRCIDCDAVSPPIETNYTLIGSHGWRLRRSLVEGRLGGEWRCPACWLAFKQAHKPSDESPPASGRGLRPSQRLLPETRRERKPK